MGRVSCRTLSQRGVSQCKSEGARDGECHEDSPSPQTRDSSGQALREVLGTPTGPHRNRRDKGLGPHSSTLLTMIKGRVPFLLVRGLWDRPGLDGKTDYTGEVDSRP